MRHRIQTLFFTFVLVLGLIILRLSYWSVVKSEELSRSAQDQYLSQDIHLPPRGNIITHDGYPLVLNQTVFALGAYTPGLRLTATDLVDKVLPLLTFTLDDPAIATDSTRAIPALTQLKVEAKSSMLAKLDKPGYCVLLRGLSESEKNSIETLGIAGINFDPTFIRAYPEASLSAHLTGFVGRDDLGNPLGYFGLEGYYNRELTGRSGIDKQEKDAGGNPLLIGQYQSLPLKSGKDLTLHLDRGVQYLVQQGLASALTRYGASSGEVIVMDPTTGAILAMVSLPTYDPARFLASDPSLYKNPAVAATYEPGSTFKVLVMAAAFNEGVVKETDHCDICSGPLPIGKYTIKTWNNEYHDNATPEEIIVHSDNVGMVWASRKLGNEKFFGYLKDFGFGEKTGIDLQEEVSSSLRSSWGEVDYATASFGQGIAVTSIQLLRAVAAIANGGELLEPHIVDSVGGVAIPRKVIRRVLSPDATTKIRDLMVAAVRDGEAKWAAPKNYTVAGKTGTAQIAVAGHYDADKTIASFVGFAPAVNPRFVMLIKLREPTTSQWGSETAAPLWFAIAKQLLMHYNIPPDK